MTELNGQLVSAEDLTALALKNYGHFTTMMVDNGRVRGLGIHLDRLRRDSQKLFGQAVDTQRVKNLLQKSVVSQKQPVFVRVTIFARQLDIGSPEKPVELDVLTTVRPADTNPETKSLSVKPITFMRDMPEVKSISIGPSLYRRRQARLEGYDDALFVSEKGEISEGTTWSIVFMQDGQIILPY